jgi:hypothetical protein
VCRLDDDEALGGPIVSQRPIGMERLAVPMREHEDGKPSRPRSERTPATCRSAPRLVEGMTSGASRDDRREVLDVRAGGFGGEIAIGIPVCMAACWTRPLVSGASIR